MHVFVRAPRAVNYKSSAGVDVNGEIIAYPIPFLQNFLEIRNVGLRATARA